ncbi:MAG: bactoprenol glucosyl transferase [Epulopiscium sp. Nele67-Bin004]|nr:MAG: bactoprenol glucosyl transferase [Epulopiscium sp. Nele67-Bin004]
MEKISIVVPCYNEEKVLKLFYEETVPQLENIANTTFEIILVNDGSKDNTLQVMKHLANIDNRVIYISLSRNFGKESAIFAGLEACTGDFVGLMDADLQDPPQLLGEMYQTLKNEDYDCVATRRVTRQGEPPIRSFFARMFYKVINKISDVEIVDGARDFRLMKRCMADAILELKEYNRFCKGIFGWVGFKTKWLEYKNIERVAGETSWSFWKLFLYSIEGIIAFSTAPLAIIFLLGILICFFSICIIGFIVVKTLIYGNPVAGWPSLICLISFGVGVQLFCIGIVGQYLARTYLEVKRRPIYIIKETNKEAIS